ncbi:MAG: zinc ribbon domain-containing protein [Acidobacteriota bacterium]
MYCPKCASTATPGQRFCRACGTNLGLIVDAMEGKRGPLDFDSLKDDLRELGLNLRVGFEEAKLGFNQKVTNQLKKPDQQKQPRQPKQTPFPIRVKNIREGSTRKYSLQQAMVSILGGSASAGVLYTMLHTAAASGLLANIERDVAGKLDMTSPTGLATVAELFWLFALIPVVKGVGHLINGIFFPVRPEPETREVTVQVPHKVSFKAASAPLQQPEVPTNELEPGRSPEPQLSVTEDETLPLGVSKNSA